MRPLLVFLLILVLVWRWRTWREDVQQKAEHKKTEQPVATDMVSCRLCGVHVPTHEAILTAHGAYCCVAHSRQMEA